MTNMRIILSLVKTNKQQTKNNPLQIGSILELSGIVNSNLP